MGPFDSTGGRSTIGPPPLKYNYVCIKYERLIIKCDVSRTCDLRNSNYDFPSLLNSWKDKMLL